MTKPTMDDQAFKTELAELIPHLRAFARSLCGNATAADDLAQEAMLKAWKARASYQAGTNLKAWTFTILRNLFYSEKRRSWRRQQLDPEVAEATLVSNDNPSSAIELLSLRNALDELPEDQREALILVGAGGLSYEETAEICGCAIGTIKSRVSRARKAITEILESKMSGLTGNDSLSAADAFEDIMRQADELSRDLPADA
ncbi:DNA-directed RNA polymerase sigma-70 factor [Henriciella pelagia]|uniref:DNA-directed RNA polymerase sigma-70 factor n=4 Tax=Henriciella pelagia TaxID=1977912 RepID=A0ABQ1J7X9_9PROT|nr:sigma-70 family RNA polymerase sigma factor [Henriciella pelagia]GGB62197.1 DNA-directed RNA polymerase sigma-70 factor [Henriciella pelagia]